MAIYTVHVPPGALDPGTRAEQTLFVRERFSLAAFLFGPLYLLRHRAWLPALAWIVVVAVGAWLCHLVRLPGASALGLLGLVMLFTGLEAGSLRRATLDRRGFAMAGVVGGRTRDEAERSFFQGDAARAMVSAPPRRVPMASGVIGLFPEAGV